MCHEALGKSNSAQIQRTRRLDTTIKLRFRLRVKLRLSAYLSHTRIRPDLCRSARCRFSLGLIRHPLDAQSAQLRSNPEAAGRAKGATRPTSLGLSSLWFPFYHSVFWNRHHNKLSNHLSLTCRVLSLRHYVSLPFCQWLLVSPAGTTSKFLILSRSLWVRQHLILRYFIFTREPHPDLDTTRYSTLLSNLPILTLNQSTIPRRSRPPPLPSRLLLPQRIPNLTSATHTEPLPRAHVERLWAAGIKVCDSVYGPVPGSGKVSSLRSSTPYCTSSPLISTYTTRKELQYD